MKRFVRVLLLSVISVTFLGCSSEEAPDGPPVLDALEEMARLQDLKENEERRERVRERERLAEERAKNGDTQADNVLSTGVFEVEFETTVGRFTVEVNREWAPIGAQRFHQLVELEYFQDCSFFRVVKGFMCQFGIAGDPARTEAFSRQILQDDPVIMSNTRGYVTFATSGPNSRSTQLFINYGDNSQLDSQGFAPIGKVTSGMNVVDKVFAEYGERPNQGKLRNGGNSYLRSEFPGLTYIKSVRFTVDDLAASSDDSDDSAAPVTEVDSDEQE